MDFVHFHVLSQTLFLWFFSFYCLVISLSVCDCCSCERINSSSISATISRVLPASTLWQTSHKPSTPYPSEKVQHQILLQPSNCRTALQSTTSQANPLKIPNCYPRKKRKLSESGRRLKRLGLRFRAKQLYRHNRSMSVYEPCGRLRSYVIVKWGVRNGRSVRSGKLPRRLPRMN